MKLGIGVDNLKFGMAQKEVFEILGSPDRTKVDQEDDKQLLVEFFKLKLRLTFYLNEKGRLGYIRTSNPDLTYCGNKIIGNKIEYAKQKVFSETISEWEIEEYDFFITHSNDEFWLTLDEEFGSVTNVEIGVTFDNDDEFKWPK